MEVINSEFLIDWIETMDEAQNELIETFAHVNQALLYNKAASKMVDRGWSKNGFGADSLEQYITKACSFFGVDRKDVFSASKYKSNVVCRAFIATFMKKHKPLMSNAEIGKFLRVNHTSIPGYFKVYEEYKDLYSSLKID